MQDPESSMEINIHNLKAKVLLDRPIEEIIPERYLQRADRTLTSIDRDAWIFRKAEDGRRVDLSKWSKSNIRYRGVFKTLEKVPAFTRGLYQSDDMQDGSWEVLENSMRAQGQVVYTLLHEILGMMKVTRNAGSEQECFYLRPRLANRQMEYLTGYQQKHKDGPETAAMVSLDFCPSRGRLECVVPISTTTKNQSFRSALEGKFKMMLSQLRSNIRRLHPPGRRLPDQEVFLIGLHGSRLHIFRALFSGGKTSEIWYGKEEESHHLNNCSTRRRCLSNPSPISDCTMASSLSSSSFPSSYFRTVCNHKAPTFKRTRSKTKNIISPFQKDETILTATTTNHHIGNGSNKEDPHYPSEPFQILASPEYDLWQKTSFQAAVRALVALITYLMSGRAKCGVLQHTFECYPYRDNENNDTRNNIPNGNITSTNRNVSRTTATYYGNTNNNHCCYPEIVTMKGQRQPLLGGIAEELAGEIGTTATGAATNAFTSASRHNNRREKREGNRGEYVKC